MVMLYSTCTNVLFIYFSLQSANIFLCTLQSFTLLTNLFVELLTLDEVCMCLCVGICVCFSRESVTHGPAGETTQSSSVAALVASGQIRQSVGRGRMKVGPHQNS